MAWKGIIAEFFKAEAFDRYCHSLEWVGWRPSFLVLHNTATPNLTQRPQGFTFQHIKNLETYYRDNQKWKSGPHLFVDDNGIWVFTPLTVSGTHSPSWNKVSLGIEMLGDYSKDDFKAGRGAKVRDNTVSAIASLSAVLGLIPATLRLHKEDHKTTHNCPGKNVVKQQVIDAVTDLMAERHGNEHDPGKSLGEIIGEGL